MILRLNTEPQRFIGDGYDSIDIIARLKTDPSACLPIRWTLFRSDDRGTRDLQIHYVSFFFELLSVVPVAAIRAG